MLGLSITASMPWTCISLLNQLPNDFSTNAYVLSRTSLQLESSQGYGEIRQLEELAIGPGGSCL
jgi:hypothetical protein